MNFIIPNRSKTFLRIFSLAIVFLIFNQSSFGNVWLEKGNQIFEKATIHSTKINSFNPTSTSSKKKLTNFIENTEVQENELTDGNFDGKPNYFYLGTIFSENLLHATSSFAFIQKNTSVPFYILFSSLKVFC